MALIYSHGTQKPSDMTVPCWVCSGLISRRAEKCPHCGHPDPVEESIKRFEERRKQKHEHRRMVRNYWREDVLFPLFCVIVFFIGTGILIWLIGVVF